MPIAVSTMAKALNVSNQELLKMMERGELNSKEVLPKFAIGLRRAAREGGALEAGMNSIAAAENKVKTAWTSVVEGFMGAGGKLAITEGFEMLADLLVDLTPIFKAIGSVFKFIVDAVKFLKPAIDVVVAILRPVAIIIDKIFSGLSAVLNYKPSSIKGSSGPSSPMPFKDTSPSRGVVSGNSLSNKTTINNNNVKIDFQSTSADPKQVIVEFDEYTQGLLRPALPADY